MTPVAKARESITRMQDDPAWFVENLVGDNLWTKQVQILEALRDNPDVTVKSCHGSGKTFTAARAALWFFSAFPDSIVISTAPTFNQVKNQLWRELNQAVKSCKIDIPKSNQTQLEADDNWYALGLSTNDTDNFQGFHSDHILAIVDEASGVDENIFEAVDGVLTSEHAKRLYIGNPMRRGGEFFRSHNDPDYEQISISVFDTPNFTKFGITESDILNNIWEDKVDGEMPYSELVTPSWAYKYAKRHPQGSIGYSVKILGQFPEAEEDTYIHRSLAEQGVNTGVEGDGKLQLGVDPARFGNDQTGFCLRKGPKVTRLWQRPITDEMQVAGEAKRVAQDEGVDTIKMDTTGVGAGAYDRLAELQNEGELSAVELSEFKAGKKAKNDEDYKNKAAEAWGVIRERLQDGKIDLPDNEDLIKQFATRRYSFDSRGRIVLEDKQSMKERGLPSPDLADAVSYAFYEVREPNNYNSVSDWY